jgi:hypothetical protein
MAEPKKKAPVKKAAAKVVPVVEEKRISPPEPGVSRHAHSPLYRS